MENKKYDIEGLRELEKSLKGLPEQYKVKGFSSLFRKVANKFIVKELKSRLNYSPETEKHIKVMSDPKDKLSVSAGVALSGFKLNWVDRGTKPRKTKKGYNKGKIEGKNEIQPIIESQIDPIVKFIEEESASEINKYLERTLKKLRKG